MTDNKELTTITPQETDPADKEPALPGKGEAKRRGICPPVWEEWFANLFLFCFTGVFLELALHLIVFGWGGKRMIYPLLFGVIAGVIFSFVSSYLPRTASRIVTGVLIGVQVLYAEVQLVYHAAFGNMMSVSQVSMGGGVMTNFGSQVLYCIGRNIGYILILLIPLAVMAALFIIRRGRYAHPSWLQAAVSAGSAVLCGLAVFALMWVGRGSPTSAYDIFVSPNTATDISYANVGMYATTAQEIRYMVFGVDEKAMLKSGALPGTASKRLSYTSEKYNMIDGLDLNSLAASAESEELRDLDLYAADLAPTPKNEFTGRMKGYNVISICAESYSPLIISEELTPALYELTHNGIIFTNFYGTFQSVTTNGEYTMCTGLFPDMSRGKAQSSFDLAGSNYLPFTLARSLSPLGYKCLGYHNYLGDFYNRITTHTNLGYDFRAIGYGLDVELQWPASDLEMMQKSADDYLSLDQPFHAYYMTFSGHYQYNLDNPMCKKNYDAVKDLPYSETVKAYISCNLELEYALEYLLGRLEESGKLNSTVIVLTNDHYPYGLTEEEYSELAGREIDTVFERYHNSFICYAPGLGENIVCDEYCSTEDILPTLLNLLGVEYDSRLFAGVDVLSDCPHAAILSDASFLTSDFRYDAATGAAFPNEGKPEPDPEIVEAYRLYAENKFSYSAGVLNHDYYSHVLGVQSVSTEDASIFTDIENVFVQGRVLFLYRKGYIEGVGEHEFGGMLPASLGEYADVLYRIAGSPDAAVSDGTKFPAGFADDPVFAEGGKYRAALIWAFEKGYLRANDPLMPPSGNIDHLVASLLLYRFALDCGIDTDLSSNERYGEYLPFADGFTEEQFKALVFFDLGSINDLKNITAEQFMTTVDMTMTRYKMAAHFFTLTTVLMDVEP